jgi:large subunit ribosomal protein L13
VKTIVPKADTIEQKWYLVDAENQVLGRLASQIAYVVKGKHKVIYTPHLDTGDHVVVINAEKIRLTGRKLQKKQTTRYTGYPGGLRIRNVSKQLHEKPETVLQHAIKGMLPKNHLGRKLFRKVRIYTGPEHPHRAQNPEALPSQLRKA